MTAAAVTLAGVGASPGTTARAEVAETVEVDARNAGASLLPCDPRTPPSRPSELVDVGGTLFFTADDGVHGQELWKSDGTGAGTVLVKDIDPGGRLRLRPLRPDRRGWDVVLRRRRRHPRPGAVEVGRHPGGHGPGQGHQLQAPTAATRPTLIDVGGTLFFTADDGIHGAGAVEVRRHRGGHGPGQGHRPRRLTAAPRPSLVDVGGTLFFTADDGTHGQELWKSDGTRAGTVLVKDIDPGDGYDAARPPT